MSLRSQCGYLEQLVSSACGLRVRDIFNISLRTILVVPMITNPDYLKPTYSKFRVHPQAPTYMCKRRLGLSLTLLAGSRAVSSYNYYT